MLKVISRFAPMLRQVALASLLSLSAQNSYAEDLSALYSASTIITGTFDSERRRGIGECFEQVLVKVSGDMGLPQALIRLDVRAEAFVESFEIRDRMAGIPAHDEQGTRERPHTLSVRFRPEAIDGLLRKMGREPWVNRPVIMLAIGVDNGMRRFVLAEDSSVGVGQRKALAAVSERLGLSTRLPAGEAVPDFASIMQGKANGLAGTGPEDAGAVFLEGLLTWEAEALRWSSQWRLVSSAGEDEWQALGRSFDSIFQDALGNAMQVLSSNSR